MIKRRNRGRGSRRGKQRARTKDKEELRGGDGGEEGKKNTSDKEEDTNNIKLNVRKTIPPDEKKTRES